ncbi:MAG: MerR family transcriptional regulator [Dehalococcoidales bacterium]|nr:MerR family transcriptional regulator [Dehalococcoidales bacterium]
MVTLSESNKKQPAENEVAKYTMGVTVRLTGVEAHRIRRYEEAGLLKPQRTEAGQRLYSDSEIALIREIAALERQGANLEGIRIILAMRRAEKEPKRKQP